MTTVLRCDLELQDSLYFATREIGRLYETERVIHNYALCYALGLVASPYFTRHQTPTYRQDMSGLNERGIYVTPARARAAEFMLNTWKYASNHYHVVMEKAQTNTPTFGRAKELTAESLFRFYIITRARNIRPPRWIRLGKWMSKARLSFECIVDPPVRRGEFEVKHPLNPLDTFSAYTVTMCDLINMPPVSLIDNARTEGEYFVIESGSQIEICLPKNLSFSFEKSPMVSSKVNQKGLEL
ncbi:MAG: type I-D CRISPR-associated protein Cas5/Csc1 [Blastocatellia bacterium]|nr:type I-D CRISPR-associated protein Cas5/Csc1 [Blastocatellia bacterium]